MTRKSAYRPVRKKILNLSINLELINFIGQKMKNFQIENNPYRGGAPVGYLSELNELEQSAILFLRYWSKNSSIHKHLHNKFWSDLTEKLGTSKTSRAIDAFDEIFTLCVKYARRPIMKHDIACKCIGGDESCFANIFGYASEGKQEDAMLLASNLITPKFAHYLVSSATKFAKSISINETDNIILRRQLVH